MRLVDPFCGRHPDEIGEYVAAAREDGMTPDEYVRVFEGTFNPVNGHFACTDCYVAVGMPAATGGWVAP